MGIINPRPAMRKGERRIKEALLKRHAELMEQFIQQGMDLEAASRKAFMLVKENPMRALTGWPMER